MSTLLGNRDEDPAVALRAAHGARPDEEFIDARTLGHMVSRTNRELADSDIARIADTYHAWRGQDADLKPYEDVPASAPRSLSTRSGIISMCSRLGGKSGRSRSGRR